MTSTFTLQEQSSVRYEALIDLVTAMTSASRSAMLPLAHSHVARGLSMSTFTVAADQEEGAIRTVFHTGGEERPAVGEGDLASLRNGDAVNRWTADGGSAVLIVPLCNAGRLRGWLAASRVDGPPFEPEDVRFLGAVARLLSMTTWDVAPMAAPESEDERVEELAHGLTTSLQLAALVEQVVARAHDLVNEPVVLWLVEGERSRAVARAGGAAVRMGEEQLLRPEVLQPQRVGLPANDPPGGDRIVIPLAIGTRIVGYLEIGPWAGAAPDPRQLRLLNRLAQPIASAIENARLHEEVRRLSLTDPLVQLPNRRHLDLFLAKECAAAERGRPLSMVIFDLDRFKAYNDTHGHLAGDKALVRFAGVLRSETRAMNLAVRYGGEEFATVLSGTDLEGARVHAERVRRRVAELFDPGLTVSAGVAAWLPEMEGPSHLIAAADRELYRAKLAGRNRVCVPGS